MKRLSVEVNDEDLMMLKKIQDATMHTKKAIIKKSIKSYYEDLVEMGEIEDSNEPVSERDAWINEWEKGVF